MLKDTGLGAEKCSQRVTCWRNSHSSPTTLLPSPHREHLGPAGPGEGNSRNPRFCVCTHVTVCVRACGVWRRVSQTTRSSLKTLPHSPSQCVMGLKAFKYLGVLRLRVEAVPGPTARMTPLSHFPRISDPGVLTLHPRGRGTCGVQVLAVVWSNSSSPWLLHLGEGPAGSGGWWLGNGAVVGYSGERKRGSRWTKLEAPSSRTFPGLRSTV